MPDINHLLPQMGRKRSRFEELRHPRVAKSLRNGVLHKRSGLFRWLASCFWESQVIEEKLREVRYGTKLSK